MNTTDIFDDIIVDYPYRDDSFIDDVSRYRITERDMQLYRKHNHHINDTYVMFLYTPVIRMRDKDGNMVEKRVR
jgi:hypothetical protein